jgi:hypothetical protein
MKPFDLFKNLPLFESPQRLQYVKLLPSFGEVYVTIWKQILVPDVDKCQILQYQTTEIINEQVQWCMRRKDFKSNLSTGRQCSVLPPLVGPAHHSAKKATT